MGTSPDGKAQELRKDNNIGKVWIITGDRKMRPDTSCRTSQSLNALISRTCGLLMRDEKEV